MYRLFKAWLSLFVVLLLVSCSGGSNSSLVSSALDSKSSDAKVFVVRNTGSTCMIYSISVSLNGQSIGKVGMKETAVGNSIIGNNTVSAKMGGIGGMGTKDGKAFFNNPSGEKNMFFVIGIAPTAFTCGVTLREVNEKQFRAKALNTSWTDYL